MQKRLSSKEEMDQGGERYELFWCMEEGKKDPKNWIRGDNCLQKQCCLNETGKGPWVS